jgi:hypothetical protein
MQNNRPVFESFQDFVEQIFEKQRLGLITEEEARISLNSAATDITGALGLSGSDPKFATSYFEALETYLGDNQVLGEKIKESIASAFEILQNKQKEISVNTSSSLFYKDTQVGPYMYLINGEVKAKGVPDMETEAMTPITTTERIRLYDLLSIINAYNFITFAKNAKMASELKRDKNLTEYLGATPVNPYLYIDTDSLTSKVIQIIQKPAKPQYIYSDGERQGPEQQFEFTLYMLHAGSPKKGGGESIERDYFTEVIKPGGTEIAIKEKPYNSSGVDFFEENDVVISASGLSALKAMVSEFNKITEIIVNGSASSKPTSREGGNQQLAEDRRAAGIKELEDLKAAGVAQLKDAKILPGTATVQKDAPKDSDPAMQQVSFIVSGNARKSEVVDTAPVTITKVENRKADKFFLQPIDFRAAYYGNITNA